MVKIVLTDESEVDIIEPRILSSSNFLKNYLMDFPETEKIYLFYEVSHPLVYLYQKSYSVISGNNYVKELNEEIRARFFDLLRLGHYLLDFNYLQEMKWLNREFNFGICPTISSHLSLDLLAEYYRGTFYSRIPEETASNREFYVRWFALHNKMTIKEENLVLNRIDLDQYRVGCEFNLIFNILLQNVILKWLSSCQLSSVFPVTFSAGIVIQPIFVSVILNVNGRVSPFLLSSEKGRKIKITPFEIEFCEEDEVIITFVYPSTYIIKSESKEIEGHFRFQLNQSVSFQPSSEENPKHEIVNLNDDEKGISGFRYSIGGEEVLTVKNGKTEFLLDNRIYEFDSSLVLDFSYRSIPFYIENLTSKKFLMNEFEKMLSRLDPIVYDVADGKKLIGQIGFNFHTIRFLGPTILNQRSPYDSRLKVLDNGCHQMMKDGGNYHHLFRLRDLSIKISQKEAFLNDIPFSFSQGKGFIVHENKKFKVWVVFLIEDGSIERFEYFDKKEKTSYTLEFSKFGLLSIRTVPDHLRAKTLEIEDYMKFSP